MDNYLILNLDKRFTKISNIFSIHKHVLAQSATILFMRPKFVMRLTNYDIIATTLPKRNSMLNLSENLTNFILQSIPHCCEMENYIKCFNHF